MKNTNNHHLHIKHCLVLLYLLVSASPLFAQDLLMQGWYWDYPKTAQGSLWADTVQHRSMDMSNAGFSYVWLPPLSRAATVPNNNSNGYDIKDLFDLGEFGGGPTGFGTRQQVNQTIAKLNNWNIKSVGDMIYNHRDGGKADDNPAVEGWIENYAGPATNCPYPSDRFRCYLPLGGSTGNGVGDYYIKLSSKSQDPAFYGKTYKLYFTTNRASATLPYNGSVNEDENNGGMGNGGGDCSQGSDVVAINTDIVVSIDASGCTVDEFKLTLSNNKFYAAGDTLWVYMSNQNGDYSDHRIYGIWNATAAADVVAQLKYQTYTNFSNLASGRGAMNYTNFRPNGNPTTLCGDWDYPYFFYDYDQSVPATRDTLVNYTKWMWQNVGIRGLRMDAVKHFPPSFVSHLLNEMNAVGQNPGFVVGESISSTAHLNTWINDVYAGMNPAATAAMRVRAFDFPLRWALKGACDQFGYDVRQVFNEGLYAAGQNPYNIVTFINNHDYRTTGDAIQNDPMLAYAYILTNNQVGLPTVFYPDYYGNNLSYMPNASFKNQIDELWRIQRYYIYGSTNIDYLSRFDTPYSQNFIGGYANTTLMYQMYNAPTGNDVVVAINFSGETLKLDQTVNTGTGGLAVGDTLVDVLGRSNFPYSVVSSSGKMYVEIPPRSYSVWVRCNNPSAPDCIAAPAARFKGKVFLEGAYQANTQTMSTVLKNNGLLPLSQPYNIAPLNYNGQESVYEARVLPPNATDWVLIEARRSTDTTIVSRQAAFLRADGTLLDRYGNEGIGLPGLSTGQSYFVSVRHRNHLPIVSKTPMVLPNVTTFDFTQLNNIAQGDSQAAQVAPNIYALPAADANSNSIVNYADYNQYAQQLGSTTYNRADLNLDGTVNAADFALYRQNAGRLALRVLR